jgi:hypothetical protein
MRVVGCRLESSVTLTLSGVAPASVTSWDYHVQVLHAKYSLEIIYATGKTGCLGSLG